MLSYLNLNYKLLKFNKKLKKQFLEKNMCRVRDSNRGPLVHEASILPQGHGAVIHVGGLEGAFAICPKLIYWTGALNEAAPDVFETL